MYPPASIVRKIAEFIGSYIVLPEQTRLVIAAWIVAAYLIDEWDRFPHLAITSPEKRCGKTTLLDVLAVLVPNPRSTTNISPAALYRVIEAEKPTLLMDESQSIARRGSEASEVTREILNAGIGKNAKVTRCGGENRDQIQDFSVYSPKVFALIGKLDGVLADRCLPVELKRKTNQDVTERYRSRVVEPKGEKLRAEIEAWAKKSRKFVTPIYDKLEPFDIENDRMAELMMPLQAVVTVADKEALKTLAEFGRELDERDKEQESQSVGVQLLTALREIFETYGRNYTDKQTKVTFIPTMMLVEYLKVREEEPWATLCRGEPITNERLATLLREYGIKSERNKTQTARGFYKSLFEEAWGRYLPTHPPETTSSPSSPSNSATKPTLKIGGAA